VSVTFEIGSNISSANFSDHAFHDDSLNSMKTAYLAAERGVDTYTRESGGSVWTKVPPSLSISQPQNEITAADLTFSPAQPTAGFSGAFSVTAAWTALSVGRPSRGVKVSEITDELTPARSYYLLSFTNGTHDPANNAGFW
jgi:hypothetical protein